MLFFHQRIAKMMEIILMLKNFEAPKIASPQRLRLRLRLL